VDYLIVGLDLSVEKFVGLNALEENVFLHLNCVFDGAN
jgi:hypothetical protein